MDLSRKTLSSKLEIQEVQTNIPKKLYVYSSQNTDTIPFDGSLPLGGITTTHSKSHRMQQTS